MEPVTIDTQVLAQHPRTRRVYIILVLLCTLAVTVCQFGNAAKLWIDIYPGLKEYVERAKARDKAAERSDRNIQEAAKDWQVRADAHRVKLEEETKKVRAERERVVVETERIKIVAQDRQRWEKAEADEAEEQANRERLKTQQQLKQQVAQAEAKRDEAQRRINKATDFADAAEQRAKKPEFELGRSGIVCDRKIPVYEDRDYTSMQPMDLLGANTPVTILQTDEVARAREVKWGPAESQRGWVKINDVELRL